MSALLRRFRFLSQSFRRHGLAHVVEVFRQEAIRRRFARAPLPEPTREELLPRLETALEQARYAYERGRFSHLEWTMAQRQLLEGKLRLLESAGRFHLLRIEIERLTGTGLEPAGETQ